MVTGGDMLGFLSKFISMRVVFVLVACVVLSGDGAATADEPVVTVAPLLLKEPSTEVTTTELSSVGVNLTEPAELIPGDTVYFEIWFQTVGPNGIASAVLDISYETAVLDTTVEQITLAPAWTDLYAPIREVDDPGGFITDVGGIVSPFEAQGLNYWAKLATIEFDVIETPGTAIIVCTVDGGPTRGFGMVGIGAVGPVDYRCACAEESSLGTLGSFVTCLSGPGVAAAVECACADINGDTHVDLADVAAFQVAFRGD